MGSADRALVLVLALQKGRVLSVREAAVDLGVAESSAHRLLSTLVGRGFATQDSTRRYIAGPALRGPEVPSVSRDDLVVVADPVLEYIHNSVGATVHLVVREGQDVIYLSGLEYSETALRVGLRIGQRMPAYCTASGRALLADLPNHEVESLYRRGLPPWSSARLATLTALKRRLATVRKDGYASSFHETEHGVVSFAVAVAEGRQPVCSIAVAMPSVRYRRPDTPRYAAALMEGARHLRARLGDLP